ncbi:MAG: sulfotransferase domain-containing protein [Chloroflexota bacterium]
MGFKDTIAISQQADHSTIADDQSISGQTAPHRQTPRALSLLRYPSLALIHGLIRPALRLAEGAGYMPSLLESLGKKMNIDHMNAHKFEDYIPTETDLIIGTYPKSGTNWMLQIAYQITQRGYGDFAHIHDVVAWPDQFIEGYAVDLHDNMLAQTSPTGQRVIKTHLGWHNIPFSPDAKYILIVRDPKDIFVSSYFFSKSLVFGPLMPSVESWLDFFLSDHFMMGSWAANLSSYWQARHHKNVLFLTYESMVANLPKSIQKVTDFADVNLSQAELNLVHQKSAFLHMKRNNHKFYPGLIVPWANPHGEMVRKGQSGTSSEILSVQQQQRIDRHCKEALESLNCDFPYDDEFELA